jgi:hypothetical protein
VYGGNSGDLRALFNRIVNKRDVTTKCRALEELAAYVGNSAHIKRDQAEALGHFAYHFVGTRLAHSLLDGADRSGGGSGGGNAASTSSSSSSTTTPASAVRASCLAVWTSALRRIPKAAVAVARSHPDVAGIVEAWRCDPAHSVRSAADEFHRQALLVSTASSSTTPLVWPAAEGLASYSRKILSYSSSSALYEGLMSMGLGTASSSASSTPMLASLSLSSSSAKDLTEPQREALGETHVRLVTTILSALALHLSTLPTAESSNNVDDDDKDDVFGADDVVLWAKFLPAPSPAVRRGAYQLLSAVALRKSRLVLPCGTRDMNSNSNEPPSHSAAAGKAVIASIAQALGHERQPGNVSGLLELVLATISAFAAHGSGGVQRVADAAALEKPTAKLVRKAGYGARVDQWGPVLLPLISKFDKPIVLLKAISDGRASTLGQRDASEMLVAHIECATYLLLRPPAVVVVASTTSQQQTTDATAAAQSEYGQQLRELWLDAWNSALRLEGAEDPALEPSPRSSRRPASGTASARALQPLVTALAKSWIRLESASQTDRQCEFQRVSTELWDKATAVLLGTSASSASNENDSIRVPMVTLFLKSIREQMQIQEQQGHDRVPMPNLTAAMKRYFEINVRPYQSSSSSIPTLESYGLYHQVLALADGDPAAILPTSVERFVMNDLLRWMIVHTSELSTVPQTSALVRHDFALLARLAADPPRNLQAGDDAKPVARQLWPALLSELVKAKLDLRWCAVGLRTLLDETSAHASEWIPCEVLDEFATSDSVMAHHSKDRSAEEEGDDDTSAASTDGGAVEQHRLDFFRLCVGLDGKNRSRDDCKVLVSRSVLSRWLERACPPPDELLSRSIPSSLDSSLLTAVLEAIGNAPQVFDAEESLRALVTAWLSGKQLLNSVRSIGLPNNELMSRFVTRASELVIQRLETLSSQSNTVLATNPQLMACSDGMTERTSCFTSSRNFLTSTRSPVLDFP